MAPSEALDEPAAGHSVETSPAPAAPLLEADLADLDEVEEDEDEDDLIDDEAGEDEAEDPMAPDPFVSDVRPALDALSPEALIALRAAARLEALSGEHKIYFSDPAGPGSLAEALNQLLQEGRVAAEFQDANGDEAHLLYRPRGAEIHPTDGV